MEQVVGNKEGVDQRESAAVSLYLRWEVARDITGSPFPSIPISDALYNRKGKVPGSAETHFQGKTPYHFSVGWVRT